MKIFLINFLIILLPLILYSDINERGLKIKKTILEQEERVALVIGNNNYTSFSKLKNPINDAKAIKYILENKGFSVLYQENISKRQFKKSIKQFSNKLSKGGVGLFFYAGHGIQVEGQNYLIPANAKIEEKDDVEYEAISLNYITKKMKNAHNRLNIIILDACRNDPFSRGGNGGLAPVQNARGMFVAYATEAGGTAKDGKEKNGVFTKALINYIDKPLSIEEVFKKTREEVFKSTHGIQYPGVYNQIIGDFYFTLPASNKIKYSTIESINKEKIIVKKKSKKRLIDPIFQKKNIHTSYIVPSMVLMKKGSYTRGDDKNIGDKDEQPIHKVTIGYDFYIGKYEVTFQEYDKFVIDSKRKMPKSRKWGRDKQPVINVSWSDAVAYSNWLSKKTGDIYRLPSEAEWEYVAKKDLNINKSNISKYAWYKANSSSKPNPVGMKIPNKYQIYDMSGNVKEWCEDWYTDNYTHVPIDGSAFNSSSQNTKVLRGGSWNLSKSSMRVSNRYWSAIKNKNNYSGFRLVKESHKPNIKYNH